MAAAVLLVAAVLLLLEVVVVVEVLVVLVVVEEEEGGGDKSSFSSCWSSMASPSFWVLASMREVAWRRRCHRMLLWLPSLFLSAQRKGRRLGVLLLVVVVVVVVVVPAMRVSILARRTASCSMMEKVSVLWSAGL